LIEDKCFDVRLGFSDAAHKLYVSGYGNGKCVRVWSKFRGITELHRGGNTPN
jgi:hypothetical protein